MSPTGIALTLHAPAVCPCCRFAKGVLSGVVPWREARRFFAWRLKRRLTEEGLIRHISSTDVSISRLDAIAMVSCKAYSLPWEPIPKGSLP